jgi:hypothetical protein
MPRSANASAGVPVKITVSKQAADLLGQIAALGIYGRNDAEVASRFVEKELQQFVEAPRLVLKPEAPKK